MVHKEDYIVRDDKQLHSVAADPQFEGQECVIKLGGVSELAASQSETGRECEAMHNASGGFE
jgi:hypothetical protein